jgi:hypothetical protein
MPRALVVAFAFTILAGAACTHGDRAAPSAPTASAATAAPARPMARTPAPGGMASVCPMSVPGTQVSAEDTATGEALTFTTTPEQAAALREKVHAMADLHNRHHAGAAAGQGGMGGGTGSMDRLGGMDRMGDMGGMAEGGTGTGGMMGGGMQRPPPARAEVEDSPSGARLLLTPLDPADADALRSTVRMHAEEMQQHGCEMMERPPRPAP